ncbi:nucleotide exchange factor GrpE [soil metagenome]|jgi:molecular chaperone GrpE|nr:nucleotide exchange factor GrpE [Actinomycetota bacterium]MDQ3218834.1 nucleotide exchange factor GrpE [Actinomycetota bacterium]
MAEQQPPRPSIRVEDKRHSSPVSGAVSPETEIPEQEASSEAEDAPSSPGTEPLHDYRDEALRLRAEFDNYRKRMVREQTAMAERAAQRLVEALLPVLDNFEAALAHGEGGPGIAMVYKQLCATLADQGLEEIPAEGVPFDPVVHEAFEAHEDPEVSEPMSSTVMRRGYRLKGHIVRHAMVSVARPPEADEAVEG